MPSATPSAPIFRRMAWLRPAQAALRHSSLDLTMNVYTDPELLDVAKAMEALPDLSNADMLTEGIEMA